MLPSTREKLRALLEPTVASLGYDLIAIELLGSSRRPLMRVSIDRPGGVNLDHCALVSHRISPLLDEADPVTGAYDLEVSSPGIDRPVQRLVDFARFAGYRARVVLVEGLPRRRYTGELRGVEGDDVKIEVDGVEHALAFADIEKAHLVLDLKAYEALGKITAAEGADVVLVDDALAEGGEE
jgi:ribosome maturation factor RimP